MEEKKLKWPRDYINIKCIIFTFYIALAYWILFKKNTKMWVYSLFTMINYFGINIYNYKYQCEFNNFIVTGLICLILSLVFYYLPKKNKFAMAFLLYLPYFVLAWYDFLMNCKFRMQPTIFPFGRFIYLPFKPAPYKKRFDNLDPVVLKNIINFDKYVTVSLILGGVIFCMFRFIK